MGEGYLLVSIFWGTLLVYSIDRHFRAAAVWSLIASACSSFGLVHAPTVFLPWKGPGTDTTLYWEFAGGYAVCALLFTSLWLGQLWGMFPAAEGTTEASKKTDLNAALCSADNGDQGQGHTSDS